MGNFKDLTGMMFGRLYVLCRANCNDKYNKPLWWVICVCNRYNEPFIIRGDSLRNGKTKSCGCLNKEIIQQLGKSKKLYNTYDLASEEYGIGYLNNGLKFLFDKEDYDLIKNYCWCLNKAGYVIARNDNGKIIKLSRLIFNVIDTKIMVDHIKHNLLDNRKSELRLVNNQKNQFNKSLLNTNTSGVTGVYWDKSRNKWCAKISYNDKCIHLGRFTNKEDAIKVRKEAENKYFGEWSYDNSMNYDINNYINIETNQNYIEEEKES